MSQTGSIEPVAELLGHSDRVWAVDWNPRQPLIASCSGDKTVRLYSYSLSDPPSFRRAHTLDGGHSRTIRSLHWRPDGRALATSSFDSTVGIWEEVREAGIEDGGAAGALVDDFTEEDGTEGTWECSASLEGHENEVKMVKWSAKGDLLATCGRDKSVWVWEAVGGDFECLAVLMDHDQDVKAVAWHPTDEILASASYDDTLRIYRADLGSDEWSSTHVLPAKDHSHSSHAGHSHAPGESCSSEASSSKRPELDGHASTVWACCFSPSGSHLASCSDDKTIRIWSRRQLAPEELPDQNQVYRIGASERERWECVGKLEGYHSRAIFSLDWTAAPSSFGDSLGLLASTGSDGKICVFSIGSAAPGKPVSHTLVASIDDAHTFYDVNCVSWCRARPPSRLHEDEDEEDSDTSERDPDGRYARARLMLATAGDDAAVRLWQLKLA